MVVFCVMCGVWGWYMGTGIRVGCKMASMYNRVIFLRSGVLGVVFRLLKSSF